MARKRTRVYVPQIDRVFDSVGAAAKFLDIDSSNINKVLKGKRLQAGGFNFINAESTNGRKPNIAGLRTKADRFIESLTSRQMLMQNKSLSTSGLASHPDFIDIKPNFKARRELRKNLKVLNNRMEDLRNKGLYNLAGKIVEETEQQIKSWNGEYADYYNIRSGDKLSTREVEKRLKSINVTLSNNALNELDLEQDAKRLGKVFLSERYVRKYSYIFPYVFKLFEKKFPDLDSEQVVKITNDLMELAEDQKISGEDIIKQLENVMELYASKKFIYNSYGVSPEDLRKLDRNSLNNLISLEKIMNRINEKDGIDQVLKFYIGEYTKNGFNSDIQLDNEINQLLNSYANIYKIDLNEIEDELSLSEEVLQTIEGWKY